MRVSTFLLSVSLAANAVLLGVFFVTNSRRGSQTTAAANKLAAAARSGSTSGVSAPPGDGAAGSTATTPTWQQLQADDLPTLVNRLREGGFPPTIVRRVISALVVEQFDRRRLEIEKETLEGPLVSNVQNPYSDPKIGPELRKLQREQTELMKQLLGGNLNDLFADTAENKALLRHQIGDIPPEKIDRLYATAMDFGEKISQIYAAANQGRTMLNADREKLMSLERAYREELEKFLTPGEVSDFMMHGSMSGGQLRATLAPFQPSEQEYRAIFPVYQAFQQQFPSQMAGLSTEQAAARRIAEEQMNTQLTALIGADRAADFKQAIDPAANQLNRLVARLELPISAAAQVVALQKDIQNRAMAVTSNASLSSTDRSAQYAALTTEAATKLTTTLGARGLEAYKQYGGQWLQNIAPTPPGGAPKP